MANKIVFMGTPMFAVPILKSLYQNGYPISDVYTQPPQKSQRGQKINKSPIQGMAETLNLKIRTPKSLKENKKEYEFFKAIGADLAIVVAYGQIIPKEFLDLTKKGFINIHVSSCSEIFIMLTPVSSSRFIIDLCIGAAPLHFGSIDA